MITQQEAEQLVYQQINRPSPDWPEKPEMIVLHSIERPLGWIVYWTTRIFHETGDTRHAIAGNSPYFVGREDGTVLVTGTAPPIEQRILAAEQKLQAHLQHQSVACQMP